MSRKPLLSVEVVTLAALIWGDDWGGQVERLTGCHRQSLLRLRRAAEAGREHPQAAWIMARLHGVLSSGAVQAGKTRRRWKEEAERMARMNWNNAKPRKLTEEAEPRDHDAGGAWTHRKAEPVKRYSKAEIAAYVRGKRGA